MVDKPTADRYTDRQRDFKKKSFWRILKNLHVWYDVLTGGMPNCTTDMRKSTCHEGRRFLYQGAGTGCFCGTFFAEKTRMGGYGYLMEGLRMLLLGAYSMEVVECGGALLKNALAGGISHAVIAFAGEAMQQDLRRSAQILHTSVEFLHMDAGCVTASYEEKLELIRCIRNFCPDIIITQDTQHSISDLDPGRRPFMTMVLEAIALSTRAYALEEAPMPRPMPHATLYYMTPSAPNCVVDISDVWESKCAAMDALHAQLVHFGDCAPQDAAGARLLVPDWDALPDALSRGTARKRAMDEAFYRYPYATGHCRAVYAEPYRREGDFVLDMLMH